MPDTPTPPPALRLAAVLLAVEGVAFGGLAIAEGLNTVPDRMSVGVSVSVFFGLYGALLVVAAWGLWRLVAWTRGPALMSQLIQLGVAWSVRDYPEVAAPLAVLSLVVLGALLHRTSVAALVYGGDTENRD